MNEIIYLEPSEEITSVIDRLRAIPGSAVAFVIPRGATIAQSIVNLKLLKKSALEMEKEISLVATDRISRNLASQIGLTVYSKVSEAQKAKPVVEPEAISKEDNSADDDNSPFRVNNYYRNKDKEETEDDEAIKQELQAIAGDNEVEEDDKGEENEDDGEQVEIKKRTIKNTEDDDYQSPENKKNDHPNEHERPKPKEEHRTNIKGSRKIVLIFGAIFALILAAGAYLFLPHATAKIQVKTESFNTSKEITIDRNAKANDVNKLVVQGRLIQSEKEVSKEFDATGTKDVGTKAAGTLSFSNNDGADSQVSAGTVVKSSGGVEFVLDQAISVPGATASVKPGGQVQINAGKVSGKVTAKDSGDKGNLPATTIYSVTGKPLLTAVGETTGGVSKVIKIVADSDITKAEASVKEESSSSAKNDLTDEAKKEKLSIFDDSVKTETISSSSSKNANDEADKFSYTIKLKSYAIGFVKSDLNDVLVKSSEKGLGKNKMIIEPEKAEITYTLVDSNIDSGIVKITAKIVGKAGQRLVEDTIKNQIKGKSIASAKQIIMSNENVEKVSIDLRFGLFQQVPFFAKNIKLIFGYEQ
ncbi:MAG: baseplate J/gp47 family protein [Patescibacteria group bacterium]|nr:baseplate J/gp47 family protein [Patescibacteria group bacterium]